MASVPDPWRTLGVPRGASLDEVKRAYRRLAKEHHPDSAGERALPRFLEIQAAYEQLVGPSGRSGAGRGGGTGRSRAAWQAEDTRAEATRRAYGSRARGSANRGPRTTAGGSRAGSGRPGGGARTADGTDWARGPGRHRPPNKATPGSTTYDGAEDQPFEPDWTGASWYGTSSGTYWTLNPREYADPRKHGPEYQARARRARSAAGAGGAPEEEPAVDGGATAGEEAPPGEEAASGRSRPMGPGDTRPSSSWWSARGSTAEATAETEATPNAPGDRHRRAPPRPPWSGGGAGEDALPPDPFALLGALERALVEAPRRSPAARLAYAAVGGVPLLLGFAWLLGELTGCGRFAATCDAGIIPVSWLAGLAIVALLAFVPRIASIAAVGTVSMILAALPATVFLSATGGSRQPAASGAALGVILVAAWVGGVAYAVGRRRRVGATDGPVS